MTRKPCVCVPPLMKIGPDRGGPVRAARPPRRPALMCEPASTRGPGSLSRSRARKMIVDAPARRYRHVRDLPPPVAPGALVSTCRIEIDLSAVDHNYRLVRAALDGLPPGAAHAPAVAPAPARARTHLCAIVKQNAYGLGVARIAKRLAALGAEMLAVYDLAEARVLADMPIRTPVLVLMPVEHFDRSDAMYRLAVSGRLHATLHSRRQAAQLIATANHLGVSFPVHVQLDTGMSRGGCLPDEAAELVELAASHPRLRLAGLMTHLSSPRHDEAFTREQTSLFRAWVGTVRPALGRLALRGHPAPLLHLANTAAAFLDPALHGSMVRVGEGLYGFGDHAAGSLGGAPGGHEAHQPEPALAAHAAALTPVMRWTSHVVHIHRVPPGWPAGYARTWFARRASRLGIVPVGYADGYPLALSNKGMVRITSLMWDRRRTMAPNEDAARQPLPTWWAPVVGRVSMDQIVIDLTDVPEHAAVVGAEIELIGRDPGSANHLPTMARLAGTITHELLCRLRPDAERVYISSADEPSPLPQGATPEPHQRAPEALIAGSIHSVAAASHAAGTIAALSSAGSAHAVVGSRLRAVGS
ncbi:MAG: hypothetical protein C0513_06190 [Isosphaera sp.]|nr:hypothetical protein [Isosphaera sp.]